MSQSRLRTTLALLSIGAAALTGCSPGGQSVAGPRTDLTIGPVDLSGDCPATVTIQTDWNPEAEQGGLYHLIGGTPHIDGSAKTVSGPLFSKGQYTGVDVQIRAGGPAIGFQTVTSQMYTDPAITLGYVNTEEAVQLSQDMPTTAVFAPLDKGPQIVMWDPVTYPGVTTIADLGKTSAVVRYFSGATYMDYLTGSGVLKASQVDGSYDGTPANFIAARGADAQQGYATVEPYVYRNDLPQWGKPVAFQLIHDTGFPTYANAISVRSGDLDTLSACLTKLVPILQQSAIDYYADPAPTNRAIVDAVAAFDTGWIYPEGVADYSVQQQRDLGLVGNGPNAIFGDFDTARVQRILDITEPIFARTGTAIRPGLTPDDLVTNRFIDPDLAIAAGS